MRVALSEQPPSVKHDWSGVIRNDMLTASELLQSDELDNYNSVKCWESSDPPNTEIESYKRASFRL